MKICNICETEKPLGDFTNAQLRNKTKHTCRECQKELKKGAKANAKVLGDKPSKVPKKDAHKVPRNLKAEQEAKRKEQLALLLNDFPTYLDYVYKHINLPKMTPLQERIAEIMNGDDERLILEAARGTGKSYIGAIYSTWRLLRDFDEKILIVSAAAPKAIEIATFIRGLFDRVPLLKHLTPDKSMGYRDSVLAFDMRGCEMAIAPSCSVAGISGQLTGRRATFILSDDVEVPANSATELQREQLLQKVQEYESLLIPDKPSKVYFLGTPQSMESIYNKLPFRTTILPAMVPENLEVYQGKLDPWILEQGPAGSPTDKVRFPKDVLDLRKAGMGASNFQLQFMLDTSLTDANRFPLKFKDLTVMSLQKDKAPMSVHYSGAHANEINDIANLGFTGDRFHSPLSVDPEVKEYDKIIMSIDPAGSGTDEITYNILAVLSGNVFILDWGGSHDGFSDKSLMNLALKAKEYKVSEIVPEKNWGGGMFTEMFRKVLNVIYPCTVIDDFNVQGQKELRIINNIEPLLTNHQIIINEDRIREELRWVDEDPAERLQYSLMYQFSHITRDKQALVHDDRLDALAIAVQYIKDMVIVDADKVLADMRAKQEQDIIDSMIDGTYGPDTGILNSTQPKASLLGNMYRNR